MAVSFTETLVRKTFKAVKPNSQLRSFHFRHAGKRTLAGWPGDLARCLPHNQSIFIQYFVIVPMPKAGKKGGTTYFCVLDFEATCWPGERRPTQEIIEFPSVMYRYDWFRKEGEYVGEFAKYVRPVLHPQLSDFCTELTGITQEQVDAADTLEVVLEEHQQWLVSVVPVEHYRDILFITCGNWDLHTMLPLEYTNKPHLPKYPQLYHHFCNIKYEFEAFYGQKAGGMTNMLDKLGLELEGRHHSGIDDTRNTARVLVRMLNEGHNGFKTRNMLR